MSKIVSFRLGAIILIASWICAVSVSIQAAPTKSTTPNIIVIFTDDQGYADLSSQNQVQDIRTPNIDNLARAGVRMTAGYITAPQCIPSRAGLLTGRYQQRFGMGENSQGPLPLEEVTVAERLRKAGYQTCMVGKWHLAPNHTSKKWIQEHLPKAVENAGVPTPIPEKLVLSYFPAAHGFDEYFCGAMKRYRANFNLQGNSLASEGEWVRDERFRVDVQTDAAIACIERNRDRPFFLYLAYFAPHVPLEATDDYLARFPGKMPERRRYALAMMSAVDDGVGRIMQCLQEHNLDQDTLIFFLSDNGAPLKIHKQDLPISFQGGAWDGSLNDPWIGEKGMLTEGGIRVPFIMQWKRGLPAGKVYNHPVISLDVAATAEAVAGLPNDGRLDGVNLIPFLRGERQDPPHEALYWRFWNQAAVRVGKWKYLRIGNLAEYLFDVSSELHESQNQIQSHPEVAKRLAAKLSHWAKDLDPPGVSSASSHIREKPWYSHYLGLEK